MLLKGELRVSYPRIGLLDFGSTSFSYWLSSRYACTSFLLNGAATDGRFRGRHTLIWARSA